MSEHKSATGPGGRLLYLIAGLGIVIALWRFANGIGAVSNLNQGYPWGFWIGFDILAGIALAAGGFVVAALVHIFGGERYHPLVRPAIFTAFLGYLLFITGLLVDIGRPWTFWQMIIFWHHESPMFEVGWCVMMYTTILFLEFVPAVLEKYKKTVWLERWRTYSPWIAWALVVLFTIALIRTVAWVVAVGGVLLLFQILVHRGVIRRDPRVPTLLIIAGVLFSTMHQSSLGTVFTMVPHKLHPLWYSPILPVLFFTSAVMTGLAMVIVEATLSARYLRRPPESDLLSGIGRGLWWALIVYLGLRTLDLAVRGAAAEAFAVTPQSLAFWLEILVGVVIPLAMLVSRDSVSSDRGLFWASLLVVIGLVINRLNVAITGIHAATAERYVPHWMEIAVSAGIVSAGILVYRAVVRWLPVIEEHQHADRTASGRTGAHGRPAGGSQP
jgi:formate dehydrogenase iron-sulfur subunit